ncbi:hypothetical protein FAM09_18285 [Niastella caeni]|uniref:Uncharacterized protein n=1 Tax=Niastella caeni TaxID=2569763 RepID=A0A4S8HUV8_9BACT|nr:hypothetical protein [Niastella caeni]THU36912.1 hypothetical protein FAM09_18285 [Niastella caeni]
MIQTDNNNKGTIKDIKERERKEEEIKLREQCQELAYERYGEDQVIKWSNQHKGLWYLPVMDESGETIEAIALMKPINRHILSYASTKISDEGLYAFLEQCMRECFIAGDDFIIEDDEYFIPAAMKFNAILEGKKAALLKR